MKMNPILTALVIAGFMLANAGHLAAAGYSKAEITRLHNDVKVLKQDAQPKDAAVGQQINPVTSVATGKESRAELRFPDQSLTRLGANSRFTLRGESRTLDLDSGVMLLQVPEQIRGAKVRTAAVTAAVTGGTAIIEYLPGGYIKLVVVEGYVDVFLNSNPTVFKTFEAGQMLIMKADSTSIPNAVDVDLKALLQTSKLLSDNDPTSINQNLVQQAVNQQQQQINQGNLVETNLVIPGRGTLVTINNNTRTNVFQNLGVRDGTPPPGNNTTPPPGSTSTPPGSTSTPPGSTSTPPPGSTSTTTAGQGGTTTPTENSTPPQNTPFQGFAPLIAGKTVLNDNSSIQTNPHVTAFNMLTGTVITSNGVIYNGAASGHLMQYFAFGNTNIISPTLQPKINAAGDWAMFRFEDLFINGSPPWITPYTEIAPEEYYTVRNVILASDHGIRIGGSSQFPEDNIPAGAGGYTTPPGYYGAVLDLWPGYESESDFLYSLVLLANQGDIILRGDPTGYVIYGYNQDVSLVTASLTADVRIEGNIFLDTGGYEGPPDPSTLTVVSGRDVYVTNAAVEADAVHIEADQNVHVTGTPTTKSKIKSNYADPVNAGSATTADLSITAYKGSINITDTDMLVQILSTPYEDFDGGKIRLEAFQNINITNSTAASDVFKARTISPNGTITINNSNINAPYLIRLYSEGANGKVLFQGNVTLDSNEVQIAGNIVEVQAGGNVSIPKNNAHIFANQHNYNTGTPDFGTMNGGSDTGITKYNPHQHPGKPAFDSNTRIGLPLGPVE